jgi:heme/copper-type cytochrome/quinol oxidase subunit 2
MIEKEIELIRKITEPAVQSAVEAYTRWYATSSVFWVLFGATLVIVGVMKFRALPKPEQSQALEGENVLPRVWWTIVAFAGTLWFGINIPDLLNPDAIAIHRLIVDLRGGK